MTFPLIERPTWSVHDSSKLDTWLSCHRRYFYEHILGWRMDVPAHDLHFGNCYHAAREHQLLYGYADIEGAFNAFLIPYREVFDQESDSMYLPKTPTGVLNALRLLAMDHQDDLIENEVVELGGKKLTEISGTVPVDEKRLLHFRIDVIMRRLADRKIFIWDHKTTQGKYINGRQWAEAFHLGVQNGTYTHCLYCLFPIEDVLGVEFYGVGFDFLQRGSANRPAGYHATFRKVPAFKTPDQMNVWLWNTLDLLHDVENEVDRMFHCNEEDTIFGAFQMNPHSCTEYRGCPFHDYCLSWSNPLQYAYEPPLGFREEFWDPREMQTTNKMDLKWGFDS